MSADERAALGQDVQRERERRFGTKKKAYTAAEVNAATWDKVEAGEPVRGDLLRRIMQTLWPDSDGQRNHDSELVTNTITLPDGTRVVFAGTPEGVAESAAKFLREHDA